MQIVKSGRWLYTEGVYSPVDIVALDSDYWYEVAREDGSLEDGELPETPHDGESLYYVRYRDAGQTRLPTRVDSGVFFTVADAMSAVAEKVPVEWG